MTTFPPPPPPLPPALQDGMPSATRPLLRRPVANPAKGALVAVDSASTKVIRFQYNPEKLTRSTTSTFYSGGASRPEPARFGGAPAEKIDLEARFDATEALAAGNSMAAEDGIRPQLAALELLAYPDMESVKEQAQLYEEGTVGVVPAPAPRTLLIFGMSRVVPVRITSINVTEELFDSNLNPIRATASISMEVVSYSQVYPGEQLYNAHVSYQNALEEKAKAFLDKPKGTVGFLFAARKAFL